MSSGQTGKRSSLLQRANSQLISTRSADGALESALTLTINHSSSGLLLFAAAAAAVAAAVVDVDVAEAVAAATARLKKCSRANSISGKQLEVN